MMRAMLWKEYREHRIIWLAMAVANGGVLLGLFVVDDWAGLPMHEDKLLTLGPASVLLAWGYGMICGAMLLAGEREEATLSFLDILPVSRLRLWLLKGQIGLLLLGGQAILLCTWLAGLCAAEKSLAALPIFLLGMLLFGAAGMAYGLFFSARCEIVMRAIGLAIVGQIAAVIAAQLLSFAALFAWFIALWMLGERKLGPISDEAMHGFPMVMFCGMTLAAVAGSARTFSRTDRLRRRPESKRGQPRVPFAASWLRLLWLCDRQMRRMALVLLGISLGLGVVLLVAGPLGWPILTLFLGVLCGITVFADEQIHGSFRFLGDQRLPLGRVWIVKTATRLALAVFASFLLALPSIVVTAYHRTDHPSNQNQPPIVSEVLHSNLIGEVVPEAPHVLMWLLYGFSVGQLCGLMSRKSIVAAMVALMGSATLVCLWVPSLVGVGLHSWQIAGPPLILLATAALLVRPWAANRLASWTTYLGVGVAVAASVLWIAAGLNYRVFEVPDVPEPFNVADYTASLPTFDEDKSGQLIRGVWGHVETAMRDMGRQQAKKPLFSQCDEVLKDGWPAGKSELGDWMDKEFAKDWFDKLAPLPDLPLGMVVDPRLLTLYDRDLYRWNHTNDFSRVLAARGLQQQARGDPAVFVENMRIALALSRNLQHHTPFFIALNNRATANIWSGAVDAWLKKLRGRPDLLKRALRTLIAHEAERPDEKEIFQADYLIARNTLAQTTEKLLESATWRHPKEAENYREVELHTAAMLWLMPWEQERHRRILRVAFAGADRERRQIREWGGDTFDRLTFERIQKRRSQRSLADLHACQLKLALRLYQEENGEAAATLAALTPRYLKSIPLDPFDGQPFRYRLSRGESIVWPQTPGEVPLMPLADEADAPAGPGRPAQPMPGGGMPGMADGGAPVDDRPPLGQLPIMHFADEPAPPPLPRGRRPLGGVGPGAADGAEQRRFVPKGQGILWSVAEDGVDDGGVRQSMGGRDRFADIIYLVPPPSK